MPSSGSTDAGFIATSAAASRGAAFGIGFAGQRFDGGDDGGFAGRGEIEAGGSAGVRIAGRGLLEQLGNALRVTGTGFGGRHAGFGEFRAGRGEGCVAGEFEQAVGAEFGDERGPLFVGQFQIDEFFEDRSGEFGPLEVGEREDGFEVVRGFGARKLERGEHRGVGFGYELLGRRARFSGRGGGLLRAARRGTLRRGSPGQCTG